MFGHDGVRGERMIGALSLSVTSGFHGREDSQPGGESDTLEVGFMEVGKAARVF